MSCWHVYDWSMVLSAWSREAHWEQIYRERAVDSVSWYQQSPTPSLELFDSLGVQPDQPVVDVGSGASVLVDALLDRGFSDVSVLDISASALERSRRRLGPRADLVRWYRADVLDWRPERRYALWHDRAVFHFLTQPTERSQYISTLKSALLPGARVVIGTFALDGPEKCSGLTVHRYDAAGLTAMFGDDFELLEQRRQEHHTPAGAVQVFSWVAMALR